MLFFRSNLLTWDISNRNVDTSIVSLDLKDISGNLLNISGLSEDIEILIPRTDDSHPENPQYFTQNENLTMKFHTFPIKDEGESIQLWLNPVNDTERFQVYTKKGSRPTKTNYEFRMEIPDFSSCLYNTTVGFFNCSQDPYMMFIGGELLEVGSIYYVGIQYSGRHATKKDGGHSRRQKRDCAQEYRVKRSCITYKDPPPTPKPEGLVTIKPLYDKTFSHNYSLRRNSFSCRYWDAKSNTWSVKGCKVYSIN